MKIYMDDRINMCADCGAKVTGGECFCGCYRSFKVSPMTWQILNTLEDLNAPIHEVRSCDYIDAGLIKPAGVA